MKKGLRRQSIRATFEADCGEDGALGIAKNLGSGFGGFLVRQMRPSSYMHDAYLSSPTVDLRYLHFYFSCTGLGLNPIRLIEFGQAYLDYW